MADISGRIVSHYRQEGLIARIRDALAAGGHDPDAPGIEALRGLDHLHGGGFHTTVVQTEIAGIPRGAHVLDAGCGIGGPSRYLADSHDCTVDAIDLVPDYVEAARHLNALVDLEDRITVRTGSVTDLPYEDGRFDAVLCQNVSMNVADKPAMFREAYRVLRPGGVYTLSHVAEGTAGAPRYPLPWAREAKTSFLERPDDILRMLHEAGFGQVEDCQPRAAANPGGAQAPGTIGPAPAMGDDMPERLSNVVRSMEEGRIVSMMIVARKG